MELFEIAIAAERSAEALYRRMATKFSHRTEVAGFWEAYANAEVGHAQALENLRDELSLEKLSELADVGMMNAAYRSLRAGQESVATDITDLQTAYELASELENGETNAVFEFLITHFAQNEQTQAFLRSQLRSHVSKLMLEFPKRFGEAAVRKDIKALST